MPDPDALLDALRRLTGRPDAEFRDGQREAIHALVDDRARVLVVQRTGWGKSAVYFLTTHLLRQQGLGPTLLISPLLALMRNQIEAARRLGLRCETINSASNTTIRELEEALRRDEIDLLLISPERLANPEFGSKIMPLVGARPGLIVIDEVHCISDWGHDFRPDYRRIGRIVDRLAGTSVPILGCTATANDRVVSDVGDQLGVELTTFRGPLRREGLALSTLRLDRQAERLAWLIETLPATARGAATTRSPPAPPSRSPTSPNCPTSTRPSPRRRRTRCSDRRSSRTRPQRTAAGASSRTAPAS